MTTDTSEKGLEALIVRAMTGEVDVLTPARSPSDTTTPLVGGTGWILGDPNQYDRGVCVDLDQLCGLFDDTDRVARHLRDDIAPNVAADPSFQNAELNTPQTARIEHDKALSKVMLDLLKDDTEVYKQFVQNESFKRFVIDLVYGLTSGSAGVDQSARQS